MYCNVPGTSPLQFPVKIPAGFHRFVFGIHCRADFPSDTPDEFQGPDQYRTGYNFA
jgi:hypothetical protein